MSNKLMLEISPPTKRATHETISKNVAKISSLVSEFDSLIELINIPEIVVENHAGEPLYKNMDAREFALILNKATGKQIAVNKVTPHLPVDEFDSWLSETTNYYGVKTVIFVGGSSNAVKYSGLPVVAANKRAYGLGLNIGNITIPNRKNEASRLIAKTKSGCAFFTTQILFESSAACQLLFEYDETCRKKSLTPAEVFLCFAPLSDSLDLDYVKWLGAIIPKETEEELKQDFAKNSIQLAQTLYAQVSEYARKNSLRLQISANIEPINSRNLDLSRELIKTLSSGFASGEHRSV